MIVSPHKSSDVNDSVNISDRDANCSTSSNCQTNTTPNKSQPTGGEKEEFDTLFGVIGDSDSATENQLSPCILTNVGKNNRYKRPKNTITICKNNRNPITEGDSFFKSSSVFTPTTPPKKQWYEEDSYVLPSSIYTPPAPLVFTIEPEHNWVLPSSIYDRPKPIVFSEDSPSIVEGRRRRAQLKREMEERNATDYEMTSSSEED